jgi:phage terminase large subunit-like protein
MGLRGPGAKPKSTENGAARVIHPRQQWESKSLSRSARVIAFLESLKVTSGILAGEQFRVEDWQRPIIEAWYAADDDGNAIIRTGLLSVARKNGKTGIAAGLALCHLLGPESEPRGQIVVGAKDGDQSGIIFDELEAYIRDNKRFDEECNIKRHEKVIEHLPTRSKFKALSSDAQKAHGLSPSVVILDELAQWGSGIGRRLYDALTTAGGARRQSLTIIIGTQSEDDHNLMSELIDEAKSGQDPTMSGFIFEIPADADVFDEANWSLANPALNSFRNIDDMRAIARRAQRIPSTESTFRNLLCNQRVSSDKRWIQAEEWNACKRATPIEDVDLLAAGPCYGGLDLGSVNDLTALALFWPNPGFLKVWSWCPKDNLGRRAEIDKVPYPTWAERGHIEPTPGQATDKRIVALRVAEIWRKYKPEEIAFDDWGMNELLRILSEEGMPDMTFRPWHQGYKSMSPATKAMEERVLNREIVHDGNPLLTWAIKNVHIESDAAGNKKPSKQRSRERIDPAVAAIMAVGAAVAQEASNEPQFFVIGG